MKALFFAAYFMALGWGIRKTGIDQIILARLDAGFDALTARAGKEFAAAFTETLAGREDFQRIIDPPQRM